jgi:hypothetical protein
MQTTKLEERLGQVENDLAKIMMEVTSGSHRGRIPAEDLPAIMDSIRMCHSYLDQTREALARLVFLAKKPVVAATKHSFLALKAISDE